jgi:hypothetical protein
MVPYAYYLQVSFARGLEGNLCFTAYPFLALACGLWLAKRGIFTPSCLPASFSDSFLLLHLPRVSQCQGLISIIFLLPPWSPEPPAPLSWPATAMNCKFDIFLLFKRFPWNVFHINGPWGSHIDQRKTKEVLFIYGVLYNSKREHSLTTVTRFWLFRPPSYSGVSNYSTVWNKRMHGKLFSKNR